MKFQDDISNMNTYIHTYIHTYVRTYIHTYIHTYIRTSRNQYVPYFFKVGGITTEDGYRLDSSELGSSAIAQSM